MDHPHVTALVNFFEEVDALPGMLDSLVGDVDRIILHDGAYPRFPHPSPISRDGSRGIIETFFADHPEIDVHLIEPLSLLTQIEKRSALLSTWANLGTPPGRSGWAMIIDADERLVAHRDTPLDKGLRDYLALVPPAVPSVCMRIVEAKDPAATDRVRGRLIRSAPGLRYEYNHYTLLDARNRNLNTGHRGAMLSAFYLSNDHRTQAPARREAQRAFYGDAYDHSTPGKYVEQRGPPDLYWRSSEQPNEVSVDIPVYGPLAHTQPHSCVLVEARRPILKGGSFILIGQRFRLPHVEAMARVRTGCVRLVSTPVPPLP